ncbi:MAG: Uma2 family endonuclease, partial [Candidatus Eremiobacterota bacterium]
MDNLARKLEKKFSYADYLTWPEDERWEIIDGIAYNMSPSPSDIHQEVISQLLTELNLYFREKKCKVYPAPFDLRLSENKLDGDDKIYDVVQPDIMVVCDSSKISYKGCKGSPDIVIEVLSLSTANH